jgi:type IV pilus assembly protein PilO
LRMHGTYHQFGSFISAVAALPRVVILTMRDVSLKPTESKAGGQLSLEGTVNTYHSVDEGDQGGAGAKPAAPASGAKPDAAKPGVAPAQNKGEL